MPELLKAFNFLELLSDRCVYKGVGYMQGQRWDDGCDLECVCENAIYGFYRCNKKLVYGFPIELISLSDFVKNLLICQGSDVRIGSG